MRAYFNSKGLDVFLIFNYGGFDATCVIWIDHEKKRLRTRLVGNECLGELMI